MDSESSNLILEHPGMTLEYSFLDNESSGVSLERSFSSLEDRTETSGDSPFLASGKIMLDNTSGLS